MYFDFLGEFVDENIEKERGKNASLEYSDVTSYCFFCSKTIQGYLGAAVIEHEAMDNCSCV